MPEKKQSWRMLPVSWSVIPFLSARQKLLALAEFKNQQEPGTEICYFLYIPHKLLSLWYAVQILCALSGTQALGFRSLYYSICPTLYLGTFYMVCFYSRANFKGCLKTKACQNSVCSHYCLMRQNYRFEITSAYSGNL